MKRTLLLTFLIFIFGTGSYAQPPGLLNPYTVCDNQNFNGHATFDLTSTDPIGSLGLNPAIYTVTFHPSVADGNNNVNVIANPSAYINETAYSQTIGVRFFNTSTSEVAVSGMVLTVTTAIPPTFSIPPSYCQGDTVAPLPTTSTNGINGTWSPPISNYTSTYVFTPNTGQCSITASIAIFVNPAPTAHPASLYFCDTMELPFFNLNDADNQISTDPGVSITYHPTLPDAQTGANPINPSYIPMITPVQTLYARVQNTSTGCFSVTTLTLNTYNCTPCTESAPINLSASNITQSSLTLSWNTPSSSTMMGNQASQISIVPQGQQPGGNIMTVTSIQNQFTIAGLQSDSCYSIYIKGFCGFDYSQWSAPLNICMPDCVNSGACSQLLVLNAFLDSNHNGVKDSGEVNFNNGQFQYQINNSGNNLYGYTNNGSYYIYDSNPANSYNINFVLNGASIPFYTSSTTYTDVTLPTGSGAHYLYFPVIEAAAFTDASVGLLSIGQPRPGFTYSNSIMYANTGNQNISNGTITFTKDPNLTITNVSESGATLTSNGFTYNFTNLAPFEVRYINISLSVPTIPTVQLGDLTTNSVTIQVANDNNSSNNESIITHAIVGSYDPNDMSESHGGKIVHSSFNSNDYLYYTVQFENTGSANADFVRVENTLDTQLDERTFEMIDASHNVNTKRVGNQLTWHFYDINLPSTSVNPSGSHGYVYYKIKPKPGYAIGDIIPNTASIYFDYNPAIVTNTFNTQFVDQLGITDFDKDKIIITPNPAQTVVNINNFNTINKISKVVIYDMLGKRIYALNNNTIDAITIDVSHFTKGIYLVELLSENNLKTTKKLIIN